MIAANANQDTERGAFGEGMLERRTYLGIKSMQLAADLAGISRARWQQLEQGYEVLGRADDGTVIRKRPMPKRPTVRRIAHVLQWNLSDAYAAAGLEPDDDPPPVAEVAERDRKAVVMELFSSLPPVHQELSLEIMYTLKYPHGVGVPDMREAS